MILNHCPISPNEKLGLAGQEQLAGAFEACDSNHGFPNLLVFVGTKVPTGLICLIYEVARVAHIFVSEVFQSELFSLGSGFKHLLF